MDDNSYLPIVNPDIEEQRRLERREKYKHCLTLVFCYIFGFIVVGFIVTGFAFFIGHLSDL